MRRRPHVSLCVSFFAPNPPVRRVSISHMCDMWGRFQHDRPVRWALPIAGWRVHRITGAQSCSILQRTTIRMHNIATYHRLWRWLDTSTARRLRPEPRAARAGDMESALYQYGVWSVYGLHRMVQLGDGVGLGPGTWSSSLEMRWTQNVAYPYAWGGKAILLECMRF